MAFWVYMLRCADGSYYTGHTDDLHRRIGEHENPETACYTQSRRPVTVVFTEEFVSREEALAMELRIKGWSRRKKEALMEGDWIEIGRLARGRDRRHTGRPR